MLSGLHTPPGLLDGSVPQILINREQLPHVSFDVELLGYSDAVVGELCHRLGPEWEQGVFKEIQVSRGRKDTWKLWSLHSLICYFCLV